MKKSIDPNTRLKKALDLDPRIVDYVVSLNPHDFERLRNPLMRRFMAPRITLRRVAAMAQVPVDEMLEQIGVLGGIQVEYGSEELSLPQSPKKAPPWVTMTDPTDVRVVDLLPLDDALDADPMLPIARAIKSLSPDEVLLIKHRWEPQPLYDVWSKTGSLEWFTEQINADEWWIWVRRVLDTPYWDGG